MATNDDLMASMLKPTTPVDNLGPSLAKEDTLLKATEILNSIADALTKQGKTLESVLEEFETNAQTEEKKLDGIKKELNKQTKTKRKFKEDKLIGAVEALTESLGSSNPRPTFGGGGFMGRGGDVASAVPRTIVELNTEKSAEEFGSKLGNTLTNSINNATRFFVAGMLGGASAYGVLTKGMIADEYEFASAMNLIAYQTKAITSDAYEMQRGFRQTGDVVRETGFDVSTFQDQLVKTVKKGIKDAVSISKIGLGLGKIMGLNEQESADIADTFGEWSRRLGLSANQLYDVSRGVQEIARFTGITGQELIDVVKSSQQFLDKMRSAGTLTSAAAKNIINLQAEARKLGVQEQISDLMGGLTNSADLLLGSSTQVQSLIFMAAQSVGRLQDALDGTMTSTKGGLKDLAQGFENVFRNLSGGLNFEDIDQLDATSKARLNLVVQSVTGKGLDDFKRIFDATKNAGKTFQERMQDVDQELTKHATLEEKLTNTRKKQELIMNKSFEFSSTLSEYSANADTFSKALENMKNKMGETAWIENIQDLATLAETTISKDLANKVRSGDEKAIAEAMALAAGKALKDMGGKDFTKDLNAALKKGDMKKFRSLQEELNKEQQKKQIETSVSTDPLGAAFLNLKAVNETIRDYTGDIVMWTAATAGSTGAMVLLLGALLAQGGFAAKQFYDIYRMGSRLFGEKAAGKFAEKAANIFGKKAAVAATAGVGSSAFDMATAALAANKTAVNTASTAAEAATGAVSATTKTGSMLGKTSKLLGKLAGPLGLLIGGLSGYFGSNEAGVTSGEGIIYGALTGGAEKGSMFSSMLGIEKGSATDLSLGVAGAAVNGGLLGAGIGSIIAPGVGTAIGAAIGTLLGSITEAIKIFREPLMSFAKIMWDLSKWVSPAAIIIETFIGVISGIPGMLSEIGSGFMDGVYEIFKPFGELFSAFGEVFTAIGEVVNEVMSSFNMFGGESSETISVISAVAAAVKYFGTILGNVFRVGGKVIGYMIKTYLEPIIFILKGVNKVLKVFKTGLVGIKTTISNFIKVIIAPFKYAFNELNNVFSMFLNPIKLIVDGFKWLINLFSKIYNWLIWPFKNAIDTIKNLFNFEFGNIDIGKFIFDSIITALTPLPVVLFNTIMGPVAQVLYDGFVGIFMGIIDTIKNLLPWPFNGGNSTKVVNESQRKTSLASAESISKSGTLEQKELALESRLSLKRGIESNINNAKWYESTTEDKATLKTIEEGIAILQNSIAEEKKAMVVENMKPVANPAEINRVIFGENNPAHRMGLIEAGYKFGGPAFHQEEALRRAALIQDQMFNRGAFSLESKDTENGAFHTTGTKFGIPEMQQKAVPAMQPLSLTNVHQNIQREYAQTNENAGTIIVPHMADMVSINDKQLEALFMIHEDLQQLKGKLEPRGKISGLSGSAERQSTKSNTKPIGSPNYYSWQFGKYDQNASQNVITDGR